jgi:hypothetical protein
MATQFAGTCGLCICVTTAAAVGSRNGLTGLGVPTPPATSPLNVKQWVRVVLICMSRTTSSTMCLCHSLLLPDKNLASQPSGLQ